MQPVQNTVFMVKWLPQHTKSQDSSRTLHVLKQNM